MAEQMKISQKELDAILKAGHCKVRDDSLPRQVAYSQPPAEYKSIPEKEDPRFNRPVDIIITSFRHRLTDPGGASEKYVIDAIVDRGILSDDSQDEINFIHHFQKKIPKEEAEKTLIQITENEKLQIKNP